jgi:hypothetical protein
MPYPHIRGRSAGPEPFAGSLKMKTHDVVRCIIFEVHLKVETNVILCAAA